MTAYKYKAISKDGTKVSGIVEAFDEFDAVDRIKESCNIVLHLSEVKQKEKTSILDMEIGNRLNIKAFTMMCSQFAIILQAGVPISKTCQLIAKKISDKKLKKILKDVSEDVIAGRSLADSFEERGGGIMPRTFIETVRAGEASGNVDKAFETVYRHFDKETKMRNKVKTALRYPIFVIMIAILVVIVLMVKVVPTFLSIFDNYGGELPGITRSLIVVSVFLKNALPYLICLILLTVILYKIYGRTEKGKLNLGKMQLKIPVIGNIAVLNAASQFANTMATMTSSGISLTKAVAITGRVMDNYYVGNLIGRMTKDLESGRTMGDSLHSTGVMPDILVDMVAVGEEAGEIEETLDKVSRYYDAELEQAISAAIGMLEPATLVFIGAVAGYIVLAIYIAMFEMYTIM